MQKKTMDESNRERIRTAYRNGVKKIREEDLDNVLSKENRVRRKAHHLAAFFKEFPLFWSLLKDYKAGRYRNVPWKLIAAVVFAVIYLVTPADVIPDFIPLVGYLDDAAVFGLILSGFQSEISTYRDWKTSGDQSGNADPSSKE